MRTSGRAFDASLRTRLLLLVLVATLPAFGMIAYAAREQGRHATAQAREEVLRLVRLAAANQERLIEGARLFLGALARLPVVLEGDAPACSALFEHFRRDNPQFTNFSAVRPTGDVFCSGVPLQRPVNVADRAYHRTALRTRDFAVGEYAVGRASGRASLFLAYPAIGASGEVKALVTAGLDLAWLNRLATEVPLPPGSALSIVDGTGTILARHPNPEQWVGQSIASLPVFQLIRAEPGERTVEAVGVDGVPRLFAFTPLRVAGDSGRIYVALGLPSGAIRAAAIRAFWRNVALLGVVTMLTLALAWVGTDVAVLRQVRTLLGATRQLAAGDLASRAGPPYQPGEVGELARAFDETAATLQARAEERERILAALRASEALFRALAESTASAIVLYRDDRIVHANPAAEALTGYPRDELIGMSLWTLTHPEDHEVIRRRRLARERGEPVPPQNELRIVTKAGETRWVAYSAGFVELEGQLTTVGTAFDITERKRAEAALAEREEHLRLFIEHSPLALAMFDRDMRYLAVSRRWLTDYRLGDRSLIGRSHYEVFPEIPQRWKDVHRRCLAGAVERCEEDAFVRADGRTDWVRWEVRPWRAAGGDVGIVIFTEDITERKKAEEELRKLALELEQRVRERTAELANVNISLAAEIADRKQAEETLSRAHAALKGILDASTEVAIIAGDPNVAITVFNSGAEKMLGYTAEEMVGKQTPAVFHLESELRAREKELTEQLGHPITGGDVFIEYARQGGSEEREWTYVRRDGRHLTVNLIVTAIRDQEGRILSYLGIATDITERKRMEAALRETNAELDAFAYSVAHDLRAPLRAMQGFGQALLEDCADRLDHDGKEYVRRIAGAAHRMDTLIEDLLAYSRLSRADLTLKPVALDNVMSDVLAYLKDSLQERQAQVRVDEPLPEVIGHHSTLTQVVTNLITNGVKYVAPGVQPTVRVWSEAASSQD